MKRVFKIVCLVAMVGLVAVSCKKKDESKEVTLNFGETSGFQAGPSFDGSKAYFDPADGYKFKWNAGDEVVIYNLAEDYTQSNWEVFTAANGGATATFEGDPIGAMKDKGYFVFYNANKAKKQIKEYNAETFEVEREQYYDNTCYADPTALVAACTTGETTDGHAAAFTLQHIFGFLNVAIGGFDEDITVDSIVVTDNSWNLTGLLSLRLPEVDTEKLSRLMGYLENNNQDAYAALAHDYLPQLGYSASGSQSKSIRLNCGEEAVPYHAWKYFFISLRPGALRNGFNVDIYYKNNPNGNHQTIEVSNGQWIIKPGNFRNIYIGTDGNQY